MPKPQAESCANCKFYIPQEGECRVGPPSVVSVSVIRPKDEPPLLSTKSEWPRVRPNDWCGDWKKA